MDKGFRITRRRAVQWLASVSGGALAAGLLPAGAATDPDLVTVQAMKPGDWVWYPERAPEGFVAILVSLADQRGYVYRNGIRIGVTTVSTGKPGHETPTGVFTILQKDQNHRSSTYNEAPMPFMERLTWSGVALHAGGLPGYPSSHGCVHLPIAFSKLLFGITHYGTPVIVADSHAGPTEVDHPGLVLPADLDATARAADGPPKPGTAPAPDPVAMVVSGADKAMVVLRGGEVALQAPVTIRDPSTPLGNVVYVLKDLDGAPTWTAFAYESGGAKAGTPPLSLDRVTVDKALNAQLAALLVPGSTLLITDLPAHAGTRSNSDFVVMTHEAG